MPQLLSRPSLAALWRQSHASSAVGASLVAALPAAAAAAATMALVDWLTGRAPTSTFLELGAPFTGSGAEASSAERWFAACSAHLAAALGAGALWGVVVAFTAHHVPPVAGALWGLVFGLALWFVAFFLVLPWVNPELVRRTPARVALLWHLCFGGVLGGLFHFARASERERHALAPRPRPP